LPPLLGDEVADTEAEFVETSADEVGDVAANKNKLNNLLTLALTATVCAFTTRSSYASAFLEIVILSVCLPVCLSDTRVLCDETKEYSADILIPNKRVIPLVF